MSRREEPAPRTDAEREAARREREARRAQREGRAAAVDPPAEGPPTPEPEVPAAAPAPEPEPAPAPEPEPDSAPEPERDPAPEALASEPPEPGQAAPEAGGAEPAPFHPGERPIGTRRVAPGETRPASPSPPPPAARRRPAVTTARVLGVIALIAIIVAGWFLVSLFQPFAGNGHGSVLVRVPSGASVEDIGDLLEQRGVVSSGLFFALRARLSGDASKLRAGPRLLRRDMSYGAALDALTTAPASAPVVVVTIPEGLSRRETVPIVRRAGLRGDYLAASRRSALLDPRSFGAPRRTRTLEGFLFPSTYQLRRAAPVKALVDRQLNIFRQQIRGVSMRYARSKNLTVYDVLTIASMIDREAGVPKDRALISAVIYNRLKRGIPLGIDATTRYEYGNWTSPLRRSQLASDSPYNTRRHAGLPPTPIGNPGLAAIRAAAHPARVPYLYYVVKPGTCGEHAFSSTNAQFQRDVARYNAARAKAGGRSPTKCP